MKKADQTDIPGTRRAIEMVATKFNIYFLFSMAMCGAVLFIVGLVNIRDDFLQTLPDAVITLAVGMLVFSLFFPWFTALYFARHLLISVKQLEKEIQDLRAETDNTEQSPSGDVLKAAPEE
jgi:hypothetical protein